MYATCHIISYVLSRLPRFHTNVSSARRVHMCALAHYKDVCLRTL